MSARKPIGQILLEHGVVSREQLEAAVASPRAGVPLASALVDRGAVSELDALKALSEQLGVPGIDVGQVIIRLADLDLLPREVAAGHRLLPVLAREDRLFCAMAVPTDAKILDELEFVTGKRVFAYVALNAPLARVIDEAYAAKEQGATYYVGPRTPDEALDRAGLPRSMRGVPLAAERPPHAPPARPAPAPPAPPPAPAAAAVHAPPAPPRPAVPAPPPSIPKAPPSPAMRTAQVPPGGYTAPQRGHTGERGARLEAAFRPSSPSIPAVDSHVVVDDAMRRSASSSGIAEPDWQSDEVSVVAPLPSLIERKAGQRVILVVDDDADIRRLLRTVLVERGHRVVEADRGLLALQMVKQDPPDLLLLDVMLPEVHGFEIARRIRGSDRYGDIPIIMISAVYRGPQVAQDAKTGYGVDAFIEKPFRIAEVVKAVDSALSRASRKADPKRDPAATRDEAQKLLADGMAAYQAGDTPQAMQLLERGARVDPLSYRLRYHLGLLYGKCDRIYDAIRELERATELNPRQYPAWKNLAVLYQQAGFRAKAVRAWERAAELAPDDPTRQAIRQQIAAMG